MARLDGEHTMQMDGDESSNIEDRRGAAAVSAVDSWWRRHGHPIPMGGGGLFRAASAWSPSCDG